MSAQRHIGRVLLGIALVVAMLLPAGLSAQRGGGGGARGGGGGDTGGPTSAAATRLAIFTAVFTLEDAQKKQVKTILDAGYKDAAPLRDQLVKSRAVIGAAIQAGKSQADIDEGVKAYAALATRMMQAETKALSQVTAALTEEQRANKTASLQAVYLMRGIFYGKKWDIVPDVRFY